MSENAKQAQEMPEIRLTLTPDEVREENNEKLEELEQKQEKQVSTKDPLESIVLSESEKATIDSFSQQIDITKSDITLQYGAAAQKKVSDFPATRCQSFQKLSPKGLSQPPAGKRQSSLPENFL